MSRKYKFGCYSHHSKSFEEMEAENVGVLLDGADGLEPMEWTGALDKNGKEIYEHNIVLWDNPDPYDWDRDTVTMVVGYNNRVMGYMLYDFPEDVGDKAGRHFFPEEVEVVGNIFEGATKDEVDYGKWRVVA
jgi:hypothetical protein